MSRPIVQACLLALCIASCGDQAPRPAVTAAAGDRIAWQGIVACADCDGIQVDLVLEQANGKRRYALTENYIAGSNSERFVEHGDWERSAGLLRLHGDTASVRVYALLPGGRLQACGSHGEPLPNATDETLFPVAVSSGN
ncbi:copper resistance protein NlpE N-terminal domain-containing protein [Cognatiluteimonas profundi]|uniref:copper resistance protein NlpE N-terminal domain-containing protein n=1 Tax=Cognatiluteimonas profundi TaxID=2594501 RepID=UPI00131B0136|nr:copper resistance protein NlpE N-terminal domain-containing protein [Lysobacter profundi]